MRTKTKYRILAVILVIVAAVTYLCWPAKTISAPENAVELDLSNNEVRDFCVSEDDYETEMENVVLPYLDSLKQTGYFEGYDGNKLYYEQYMLENPKAHIVVAHGFTDASYKFREVIYYFLKSGYSVSIMEHRGHGYSYRAVEDMSKVTVSSFDEYVDDFKIFVDDIVRPVLLEDEKLFVYGHSMGGAIVSMLLEQDSTLFDAAVLSSPMMEILFDGIPSNAVGLLTNVVNLIGLGDSYILGSGEFDDTYIYEDSSYTSEAKYAYILNLEKDNEYYHANGGTFKWLKAAVKATKDIRKNAGKYQTDTILFQAGLDKTVGPNGQNEFAKKASNVQLIQVPQSRHSILFTENSVFIPYMNTILDFYEEHL